MKFHIREKEVSIWIGSVILIVIIWALVLWSGYGNQVSNKNVLLNAELNRFEGEVYSTLKTYEAFSNYV